MDDLWTPVTEELSSERLTATTRRGFSSLFCRKPSDRPTALEERRAGGGRGLTGEGGHDDRGRFLGSSGRVRSDSDNNLRTDVGEVDPGKTCSANQLMVDSLIQCKS